MGSILGTVQQPQQRPVTQVLGFTLRRPTWAIRVVLGSGRWLLRYQNE